MSFSDRTLNGAYRKMLRAACIHIGRLAHNGGADDMFTRDRYDYFGERKGGLHFKQPGLRNMDWNRGSALPRSCSRPARAMALTKSSGKPQPTA